MLLTAVIFLPLSMEAVGRSNAGILSAAEAAAQRGCWTSAKSRVSVVPRTTGTLTGVGTALRRVRAACMLVPGVARVALRA